MSPESPAASTSSDATTNPHFKLERFVVRKVLFNEVERQQPGEGEQRPRPVPLGLEFNLGIQSGTSASGEWRAIVILETKVTPEPKWQPYRIEVVVQGAFAGVGVTEEQFDEFCRLSVPPILFPYVREIVHRVTMDGMYGNVKIDPVNIAALAAQGEWTSVPLPTAAPERVAPESAPQPEGS